MNGADRSLLLQALGNMKSGRVANYALPGLDSFLLDKGRVRLFEASRHIDEKITPHNHRYELTNLVLRGNVWNTTWMTWDKGDAPPNTDTYRLSRLTPHSGGMGNYLQQPVGVVRARAVTAAHTEGSIYHINANEFHSIQFSRDAVVLVFEGPPQREWNEVLEPVVDGIVIPTMGVHPWMFRQV